MVQYFQDSVLHNDPFHAVFLSFFLRYPNPHSSHVISVDVLSRHLDPNTGRLFTRRLLLKRGSLPKWAPKGIMARAESWVLEDSEVDVQGRVMRHWSRNLDHRKVLEVGEGQEFYAVDDRNTRCLTTGRIISRLGWGLTNRVEKFGITRFAAHVEKSRQGLNLVLSHLRDHLATHPPTERLRQAAPFAHAFGITHQPGEEEDEDAGRTWENAARTTNERGDEAYPIATPSSSSHGEMPIPQPTPNSPTLTPLRSLLEERVALIAQAEAEAALERERSAARARFRDLPAAVLAPSLDGGSLPRKKGWSERMRERAREWREWGEQKLGAYRTWWMSARGESGFGASTSAPSSASTSEDEAMEKEEEEEAEGSVSMDSGGLNLRGWSRGVGETRRGGRARGERGRTWEEEERERRRIEAEEKARQRQV